MNENEPMDYQPLYFKPGYTPHALPDKNMYPNAVKELAMPALATPLGPDFKNMNDLFGGFRPHEFSILCGATGTGKTTLVANWSAQMLKQGVRHFVASVETGPTDFVKRVISVYAGQDWNTGLPVPLAKLMDFDSKHSTVFNSGYLQLSLYDNRFSVDTLMADIEWMVDQQGIEIAFIDNLNFFLEVSTAQNQVIEMDRATHKLVMFCKRVPVHVVMVMHPKKTDNGRVESEFDIKGSSTAVQEAHNVFLFNRPSEYQIKNDIAESNDRELKIAKLRRRGISVGKSILLKTTDGVKYQEKAILG